MRRIILTILALNTLILTAVQAETVPLEKLRFDYMIDSDGYQLTSVAIDATGHLQIPSLYDDGTNGEKPVIHIAAGACASRSNLTALTLPNQLNTIGHTAFTNCPFTGSLEIPASVTFIDYYAFVDCDFDGTLTFAPNSQLIDIGHNIFLRCNFTGQLTIPPNLTHISDGAFALNNFNGPLKIPASVIRIGDGAFNQSISDSTLTFAPDSQLTTIGDGSFVNNYFTGSIEFPASLISIGHGAFNQSTFDGTLTFPPHAQLTTIGNGAFFFNYNLSGSLELPASLVSIGQSAFAYCDFDGTLTFAPNAQLTTIGDYAFASCDFIGSLEIPTPLISIGEGAFADCGFDGTLTFAPNSQINTIDDDAFASCNFMGSLEIPALLISIGKRAFSGCRFDGTLTFSPNTQLSIIDNDAFICSPFIGSLNIPASVTYIGDGVFSPCYVVDEIGTILNIISSFTGTLTFEPGSQLTTIGNAAFDSCGFSGSLEIPASLTAIGQNAFQGITNLTEVCWLGAPPFILNDYGFFPPPSTNLFFNTPAQHYVPNTHLHSYQAFGGPLASAISKFSTTISLFNENIGLSFTTRTGATYQVQFIDDLTSTNWINSGSIITGSGETQMVEHTPTHTHGYYRIVEQ